MSSSWNESHPFALQRPDRRLTLLRQRQNLYGDDTGGEDKRTAVIASRPNFITESLPINLPGELSHSTVLNQRTSPPNNLPSRASNKEAEVDLLTNLLVQNLGSAADPEFFGNCSKCNGKVIGEKNGVSVQGRIFHSTCFVCKVCDSLLAGRNSYVLDGKPSCENCFLNSLQKCSACAQPISDRILRATGKPFHPGCFVCVVCGRCLDGVPFTVDATNQIHCIDDFHRKFAPRCGICQQPIMPVANNTEAMRIIALDRSFHVQCYRCEYCGIDLTRDSDGCFPLDDHIYCRSCNAQQIRNLTANVSRSDIHV